jgi:hypothetical protein
MFARRNELEMGGNSWMFNGALQVAKYGGRIKKILNNVAYNKPESKNNIQYAAQGGKMNIIPEGALHAHKHNLNLEDITKKGIPVISEEQGGEITQHAEIERNEIIFTKETSERVESLWKKYNEDGFTKKQKELIAIQAGELLTYEIIENTDDRTGLITII